jgi:hypothetical protein
MVSLNFISFENALRRALFVSNKINNNFFVAWIEGFAIMVAVAVVATVGSLVDWKKEVQFVISRAKSDAKNIVSYNSPLTMNTF